MLSISYKMEKSNRERNLNEEEISKIKSLILSEISIPSILQLVDPRLKTHYESRSSPAHLSRNQTDTNPNLSLCKQA